MSVATPTVIPRTPLFPTLLPKPPQPHPLPLPRHGQRRARLNAVRDLNKEMDDLSDEEELIEENNLDIKSRGFNFLIPIGRSLTQHEEKNDADASEDADDGTDDDDDDDSDETSPSEERSDDGDDNDNDDEDEEGQDLDADMEDLDDAGNTTAETDDMDADESDSLHPVPSSDF